MRKVGIVGAGITECRGRWVEATYWELFQMAVRRTLDDAKMKAEEVDSVVYGIYNDIFEHQAIPESSLTGLRRSSRYCSSTTLGVVTPTSMLS